MLPSPPTSSPTKFEDEAGFWYPVYEISWDQSGCSNKLPLPYNNINDRPRYITQEVCCASAYSGQVSMACVCDLPSPALGCPGIIEYTATTTTATISSPTPPPIVSVAQKLLLHFYVFTSLEVFSRHILHYCHKYMLSC